MIQAFDVAQAVQDIKKELMITNTELARMLGVRHIDHWLKGANPHQRSRETLIKLWKEVCKK